MPGIVERLDLDTRERRPWRVLQPDDRAGIGFIGTPIVRPDVDAYAYFYGRFPQHLSLVEGAR